MYPIERGPLGEYTTTDLPAWHRSVCGSEGCLTRHQMLQHPAAWNVGVGDGGCTTNPHSADSKQVRMLTNMALVL